MPLVLQEHIDLVRSEFKYVFKNILDKDHFEGKIYFRDPITRVSFFRGKIFSVDGTRPLEASLDCTELSIKTDMAAHV